MRKQLEAALVLEEQDAIRKQKVLIESVPTKSSYKVLKSSRFVPNQTSKGFLQKLTVPGILSSIDKLQSLRVSRIQVCSDEKAMLSFGITLNDH